MNSITSTKALIVSHTITAFFILCINKYSAGIMLSNYNCHKRVEIEERALEIAHYIIENRATVRQTAKEFGVSKSTVHVEVTI